jgi:hypothetical protein
LKKLTFLGIAAGLGVAALVATQRGHAADHLDSPTLVTSPLADINDLYTWMDGTNLILAMSISPADADTRVLEPDVQYVFHVHSKTGLGVGVAGTGVETRVICQFKSNSSGECWVVDAASDMVKDYVSGNPSSTTGISSASGKVRLFAGRRSDPFFFNLQGFRSAIGKLTTRLGQNPPVMFDAAGCPSNLNNPEVVGMATDLGAQIVGQPPCSTISRDCFSELNVRVILVQLDSALVNAGTNTTVGVWASTHATPSP